VLLLSLFVGFMTMISFSAKAETLVSRSTPRMMQGVRPLGMGGAFVAVAGTDENALFYNPAAINDFPQEFHFQFLLPTAEFSYKSLNFLISDVPDLVDDIDAANGDSAKIDVLDAFAASKIEPSILLMPAAPPIVRPPVK